MMRLKRVLKNCDGFTLVELVVVITLISILVTIAMITYTVLATKKAREKACESNINNTSRAISAYLAVNNDYPNALLDLKTNSDYFNESSSFSFTCPSSTSTVYQYDDNTGEVDCPIHNFDPSFP